jgi:hypothetical protein
MEWSTESRPTGRPLSNERADISWVRVVPGIVGTG